MKYNQLGRTGLYVSEMCLGTMTFGTDSSHFIWKAASGLDQAASEGILASALAAGVNFIDTADVYTSGQSESMLGLGLKNLGVARKDVVIATKVFGRTGAGPNDRGASRGHIMDAVKGSLERLQTDYIDLYQIHSDDRVTPMDETLRALDDLISQGLVRYIGISNWPAWKITKSLGISAANGYARFETSQSYYSIAGRDIERELVPMMKEEKIGLMVWSPLAGGLLSGKFGPDVPKVEGARRTTWDSPPVNLDRAWATIAIMREVGKAHGVSVARVALAWVLSKSYVTSVIIGAKTAAQIEDNLAAADLVLTSDEIAKLDEVSAMQPEYPAWIADIQHQSRVPQAFVPKKT